LHVHAVLGFLQAVRLPRVNHEIRFDSIALKSAVKLLALAKGDLDAALKDYNFLLRLNPNNVRAHSGQGQLFEKRRDLAQARADYRSASFALTPFDNIDAAMARSAARERLAALTPQVPGAANAARRVALIVGNGAYKNAHPLPNPPRDAKLIAATLREVGFQT
jgi:tetratricopeptide (TPR) repeat protein